MNWLELVVTQGRRFRAAEEHKVAGIVEEAIDVPARRTFCTSDRNVIECFIQLEGNRHAPEGGTRISLSRLRFFQSELRRAFRDVTGQSLDELNLVDEATVAERIPEAVQ